MGRAGIDDVIIYLVGALIDGTDRMTDLQSMVDSIRRYPVSYCTVRYRSAPYKIFEMD